MILVFGATGTVGGEVARQLIARGERPRLLVRDPAKAHAFDGSAEIMRGDFNDPQSLAAALTGVEKAFLVTGTHGGVDPALEFNAIDAAKASGVAHLVKLSVVGVNAPIDTFARLHARCEAHLQESGISWTMVRPHYFMSNVRYWSETIRSQGAVYYPTAEGRWAAVDPADIAAVAVAALTSPGHSGKTYSVSGPESLSAAQYVERLSAAIGKPIRFVNVPLEVVRDNLLKGGMPAVHADALMDLLAAMKDGRLDFVDDGVHQATGRSAKSFDDWARCNAAAFR